MRVNSQTTHCVPVCGKEIKQASGSLIGFFDNAYEEKTQTLGKHTQCLLISLLLFRVFKTYLIFDLIKQCGN